MVGWLSVQTTIVDVEPRSTAPVEDYLVGNDELIVAEQLGDHRCACRRSPMSVADTEFRLCRYYEELFKPRRVGDRLYAEIFLGS